MTEKKHRSASHGEKRPCRSESYKTNSLSAKKHRKCFIAEPCAGLGKAQKLPATADTMGSEYLPRLLWCWSCLSTILLRGCREQKPTRIISSCNDDLTD
eukprot:scaffold617497_cov18-Prasinocladus_malaysianus.AAC.1